MRPIAHPNPTPNAPESEERTLEHHRLSTPLRPSDGTSNMRRVGTVRDATHAETDLLRLRGVEMFSAGTQQRISGQSDLSVTL